MNRVLDRLWIGSAVDLRAPLKELGFSGIVDLRDCGPKLGFDISVLEIENRDGDAWTPEQLDRVFKFIGREINNGKVLVACAAGMSRSASIVIGFLVRCGWSATEAFEHLRATRPRIAPVSAMLTAVLK